MSVKKINKEIILISKKINEEQKIKENLEIEHRNLFYEIANHNGKKEHLEDKKISKIKNKLLKIITFNFYDWNNIIGIKIKRNNKELNKLYLKQKELDEKMKIQKEKLKKIKDELIIKKMEYSPNVPNNNLNRNEIRKEIKPISIKKQELLKQLKNIKEINQKINIEKVAQKMYKQINYYDIKDKLSQEKINAINDDKTNKNLKKIRNSYNSRQM